MSLLRRRALITGSTSGIGLGIARRLAAQGADVILNGFGDSNEISKLCQDIKNTYKVNAVYASGDMADVTSIENMMSNIDKTVGGVDILINNAGIQHVCPIDKFPTNIWDKIIAINLTACFHTTRLVLPHMKNQNWGRIVNIASVHGLVASAEKSAYVAAKHGVVGMTKVTALELAKTKITANAICPGWVLTPLVEKQIQDRAAKSGVTFEVAQESLLSEKQPSAQFVTPDNLGDITCFLCSESAAEVRGVAWALDGGWTAQ
jgi:3-hydroxybutyrate dehydrogenase